MLTLSAINVPTQCRIQNGDGLKIRYIKDLNYLVFQQFLSSKTTFNCRNCRKQTLIINQSIFSVV